MMLQLVLRNKPEDWEDVEDNYVNVRYKKFTIEKGCSEYNAVAQGFSNTKDIETIERVQHPYAYGRCIFLAQQIERHRNRNVSFADAYYKITPEKLHVALDYNLDPRRTNIGWQSGEPILQEHITASKGDLIIVVKKISCSMEQTSDAAYYPTYVVQFQREEDADALAVEEALNTCLQNIVTSS